MRNASFGRFGRVYRRIAHTGLLFVVVLLSGAMVTSAARAAIPAPSSAPVRHGDGGVIVPTGASPGVAPRATDLPPTDTATPTSQPTATSGAAAPHAISPRTYPRIPTHPAGGAVTGTISPLPTRHPDSTIPTMSTVTPITRIDVARGIQYTSWWNGEYSSAESDLTIARNIVPLGVNWIAPIVTCYSQTITSTTIDCGSPRTPTDADLQHIVAKAHALGLKVMLKPHVDLSDPNYWRGQISMATAADWNAWFANYTTFITHYATLAQSAGVDMFSVGCELEGTSGHATEWRQVVMAVRAAYTGPITYASNHGEEVGVAWWNVLDYIGVDAYYPLTTHADPTIAELKTAWAPAVTILAGLSTGFNKPVIFTEVGYQSQQGTNITPWNTTTNVLDLQEQANCYTALLEVFRDLPWWRGVFWWSAIPNRNQGGPTDTDFTPINKPAQEVLRAYYGGVGLFYGTPAPAPPGTRTDRTRRSGLPLPSVDITCYSRRWCR